MTISNQNLLLRVNNNMISDALTAVGHDNRTQTIAFAGLWSLLSSGMFKTNWAILAAASQLETEANTAFRDECFQIFRELRCHQAAPGIPLCDNKSADLHVELTPYIDLLRASLLEQLPETQRATHIPTPARCQYRGNLNLVKSKLNRQNRTQISKVLDAITALNSVGYRINQDIAQLSNLPDDMRLNYSERYASRQSDILSSTWLHGTFYFKHTLDSRGRVYARSTLVTPQGDSFSKASLNFAEKKPLGEFGLGALAVHYANCSGHDKLSYADRIRWAKTEGLAKAFHFIAADHNWADIAPHIEDRKHAFEEYTAALEFARACNYLKTHGECETFLSGIITHQDATTSGFQFGAALLGDRETARLTNITGEQTKNDKPADLYGRMAEHLIPLVKTAAADEVNLAKFLPLINRNFCKKPIMTTGYGAGIKTIMKHIGEYCADAERPELATTYLLAALQPLVQEALQLTASSMLTMSEKLRDEGKMLIERGEETITWTCPDGFTVYQQYRDTSARKVKLGRKSGIRAKVYGEIDPIDEGKMATALPPNFIHSIDAQMVRTVAIQCNFEGIALAPIHDSFGTHAGTFKALNKELRFAFAETLEYDWVAAFNEANEANLSFDKGDYNADEALLGVYMFS